MYDVRHSLWWLPQGGCSVMVRYAHEMNGNWYPWAQVWHPANAPAAHADSHSKAQTLLMLPPKSIRVLKAGAE